jgi:hypothetical protein
VNRLLEAATRYAALGWHVFPIRPGEKTPLTAHGVKDATIDAKQILAWWTKWPDANVAVACGKVSGIYVVDVDVTEDGKVNGYDSLGQLSDKLPATVMQTTPRGGCHVFYSVGGDLPPANKNSLLPGVDIRGDGYYVLLAPSVRADGKRYAWANGQEPWSREPAEYPDFLRPASRPAKAACQAPAQLPVGAAGGDALQRAGLYLAQCDAAVQGQAGHDKLLWAAGCMTWGYELSASQAYDILVGEYNPRCVPPWDLSTQKDEKDFRRKITQSIQNPPSKPRGWLLSDDSYAPMPITVSDEVIQRLIANAGLASSDSPRGTKFPSWDLPLELGVTHEQITKKMIEAHKNHVMTPPGDAWENHTATYSDTPSAEELTQKMLRLKRKKELEFLTQPTGLFGELCSWINATAFKPQPYLTLGCALAFLGVLFGRKVKDTLGSRTNLYVMSVAKSSAGKNHAMKKIRQLCMAANCVDLLAGSNIASDSAIESRVAEHPASIFLLDEIGHLLVNIKSGASKHQAQIVSSLMQLYSSASDVYLGREYADAVNQRRIVEPCLCIYGVSTPEIFASGLSSSELNDGWLSRCLVFYVEDEPRKLRDTDLTAPPPQHLVELVSAWAKRTVTPAGGKTISQFVVGSADSLQEAPPEQIIVPTNADAEKRCRDFDDMAELLSKNEPQLSSSWLKAEENARRIALIIGCSDSYDSPVVTIAAADRACRMVKMIIEDFGTHVVPEISDGRTEAEKSKIIGIVREFGFSGCTKREITRKTRWAGGRQRNDLLADLVEGGDLVCKATPSGHGVQYWAEGFEPSGEAEVSDE